MIIRKCTVRNLSITCRVIKQSIFLRKKILLRLQCNFYLITAVRDIDKYKISRELQQ